MVLIYCEQGSPQKSWNVSLLFLYWSVCVLLFITMLLNQMGFHQNIYFIGQCWVYGRTMITKSPIHFLDKQSVCTPRSLQPDLQVLRTMNSLSACSSFGSSTVHKAEKLWLEAIILERRQTAQNLENEAFFTSRCHEHRIPEELASIKLHVNFKARLQSTRTKMHENKLAQLSKPAEMCHCPQCIAYRWKSST